MSENVVYSRPADGEGCGGRKPSAFKINDIAERSSAAQTRATGPTWLVPIREYLRQDIMFEDRSVRVVVSLAAQTRASGPT